MITRFFVCIHCVFVRIGRIGGIGGIDILLIVYKNNVHTKRENQFFLCCFCGIKIHSNRYNLDLHEKLHGSHISKIKCAAKECDSTLANKSLYWKHWIAKHNGLTMPDFLIYVDVPIGRGRQTVSTSTGRGRRIVPSGLIKKVKKTIKGGATQNMKTKQDEHSDDIENDFTRRIRDIENIEKQNTVLNLDIENTIEMCLNRDPNYGCLNDLNE